MARARREGSGKLAASQAVVSHNHPHAVAASQAVVLAIRLALHESPQAGREIVPTHQGVDDGQGADAVIGEATVGIEKREGAPRSDFAFES
jgi:ADP-ribosylglycohydrolase